MKLLPKKEVDAAKATDRRREVEEGVKLAKKVDALRELRAKEEANLQAFRDTTIREVREQIQAIIEEKTALEKDIEEKTVVRNKLLQPLDQEWLTVKRREQELTIRAEELDVREVGVALVSSENQKKSEALETEKGRITDERKRTTAVVAEAERIRDESNTVLSDAIVKAERITKKAIIKERSLVVREENVAAQERDLENTKLYLKSKEIELEAMDKQIKDRYETLQRSINRLK